MLSEADRSLLCQEMDVLLRTLEEHGVVDPRGLAVRPQTPPAKHPPRSHSSLSVWGEHAWGASVVQGGGCGGRNVISNSLQGSHVISNLELARAPSYLEEGRGGFGWLEAAAWVVRTVRAE